jgi:phospholipase/lecithinase/hemolysin
MIDKYIKLQKYCNQLFENNNISVHSKDKYKIMQQVALYIDALIFNIVSIICLITMINNSSKITEKTLAVSKQYIESKCQFNYAKVSGGNNIMTGGSRLGSATFMGISEPMYRIDNPTNNILTTDFANGILRPQIGGASLNEKLLKDYMNSILSYHGMKVSNNVRHQIETIINVHIMCLINNLKSYKTAIRLSTLTKIVKNNKILHPLN